MSVIKIPSFRIYDKENDKYIDNVVTSIDYSGVAVTTNIIKDEDNGVSYESHDITIGTSDTPSYLNQDVLGQYLVSEKALRVDYMRYRIKMTLPLIISFPRSQNNNKKYILSIDTGHKTEGGENIPYTSYSAAGVKMAGDSYVSIAFQSFLDQKGVFSSIYSSSFEGFSGTTSTENVEVSIGSTVTKSYNNISFMDGNTMTASIRDKNFEQALSSQVTWEIDENDNIVIRNMQVPVSYDFWYPRDVSDSNIDYNPDSDKPIGVDGAIVTGHYIYTLEQFIPTSFTLGIRATYRETEETQISSKYPFNSTAVSNFNVEGNTFSSVTTYVCKEGLEYANINEDMSVVLEVSGFDSEDGQYGVIVSVKDSWRIPAPISVFNTSNGAHEFVGFIKTSDSSIIIPNIRESQSSFVAYKCITLFDYTPADIYREWKNGKETATIRVSVNDYYDTDGNLALSITDESKPMLFKNGDTVIPYVATPNGDRPMSVHPDGTPKEFLVTGVTLISDGAVWQELQLQEVSG